ncbi:heme peroxidase [Rhodococcus sp. ACT016]|uniref:heme peroxidase n=1 Tax=Rhodococcus sp. ACT016 TaxID=3134808 RepID=UPI003D27BF25
MSVSEQQVQTVTRACRERLGDPAGWVPPDEYRNSLALCIIESVQAAGTRFADAGTVVDRYLAYRRAHEAGPITDGARALLRTFEEAGSADQWAGKIGNYKRRYSESTAPLRAIEIQRAAERLHDLQIDSIGDLVGATRNEGTRHDLRTAWDNSCGARDETTWQHLLLLAGAPGADDDTAAATDEFVRSALASSATDTDDDSPPAILLAAAADRLDVPAAALEHAVRRWRCTREDHSVRVP